MKNIFYCFFALCCLSMWSQNAVIAERTPQGNYKVRLLELNAIELPLLKNFTEKAAIYHQIGYYSKAILNYKKAIALEPSELLQVKLAQSYHAAGMAKDAIGLYEGVFVKDSSNLLVANQLARLYTSTRKVKQAITLYEYLIEKDQTNPNYSYRLAKIFKKQRRPFAAGNLFLDAYKKDTVHRASIFELAKFYKRLRFKDSTYLFLDKGLALNKEDLNFLQLKASVLYTDKNYELSLEYIQKLRTLKFKNAAIMSLKGACFEKMNQLDSAQVYFGKAVSMDRESMNYAYKLANIYYKRKNFKQAKIVLMMALFGAEPDFSAPQFLYATIYQEEGKLKEAIRYFKKAYQSGTRFHKALFQWAVTAEAYYKDKKVAMDLYEKYVIRFESKDAALTKYANQRIKIIRKNLFLKGEIAEEI